MIVPNKITSKINELIRVHTFKLVKYILIKKGRIKAISTSKIINRIAIRKNRMEKGIFAGLKKLNPHSNGVDFSRQFFLFFENVLMTKIKIVLSVKLDKTRRM